MKTACRVLIVALVIVPTGAPAQTAPAPEDQHEVTLDIDNDGKMDRAVLAQNPKSRYGDLMPVLWVGRGLRERGTDRRDGQNHGQRAPRCFHQMLAPRL